ncbi:hypothetical protein [Pustulibacterium marinum]|uniref:hypothetical protein n=1 Tax=Pustulibacterium marinum TaxID=1224947 RepID=UPI000B86A261|nr:hypothetical protein [Pustulibacterium marinum]
MKITKKHIFNLLALFLCFLSVSAKTNSLEIPSKHSATKTTEVAQSTKDELVLFDLVEEITISHFSQDNSEDYTNLQTLYFQNVSAYQPFKYLQKHYSSAAYRYHNNKEQLLLLIFPFHYFY